MEKMYIKYGLCVLAAMMIAMGACTAKAQSAAAGGSDLTRAFSEAGLPLLKEPISGRDFSLPLVSAGGTSNAVNADDTIRLSDLKGKVVFLNFWATWCGPCRSEMPSMQSLYDRYRERGLEILAVNMQEGQDQVIAFMNSNNLSFPAALDSTGRIGSSYGIQAIPTSFIINREGNIIVRLVGSIDWDTPKIQNALELLLN